MLEIAVGVFVPWLWQKIADIAKSKDDEAAIRIALEESTRNGFKRFIAIHSDLAASLFDQYFLENHAGPELAKFLTRKEVPDVAVVATAFRAQFGKSCPAGIEEAIADLLNFVMEAMKEQTVLQSIINQRQIEETNQIVKAVSAEASVAVDLLEHQSKIYTEDQKKQSQFQIETLQFQENSTTDLKAIRAFLENNLSPQSSGNEFNKLLAKQLDMVRDKIRNSLFVEALAILNSHRDEVAASDSFTKFRWHTNMATCMLAEGNEDAAANEYQVAFGYAPDEEKAQANRARAFLIKHQYDDCLAMCEAGIAKFPNSSIMWALRINARMLLGDVSFPRKIVFQG